MKGSLWRKVATQSMQILEYLHHEFKSIPAADGTVRVTWQGGGLTITIKDVGGDLVGYSDDGGPSLSIQWSSRHHIVADNVKRLRPWMFTLPNVERINIHNVDDEIMFVFDNGHILWLGEVKQLNAHNILQLSKFASGVSIKLGKFCLFGSVFTDPTTAADSMTKMNYHPDIIAIGSTDVSNVLGWRDLMTKLNVDMSIRDIPQEFLKNMTNSEFIDYMIDAGWEDRL